MNHYRYECVLTPEEGKGTRSASVITHVEITKGMTLKIKKSKWVAKVVLPAETTRPHIGDLIAQITKTKPR